MDNEETVQHLLRIVRLVVEAEDVCFLMTRGEAGQIDARLMQPFGPEEDMTFWFGTSDGSRKVQEVEREGRATVGYLLPAEGAYVTFQGRATVERDPALRRRYWRESFAEFWPEGPEGPDYVLIRFRPSRLEVMHLQQDVAPDPYGLQPAVLWREGENWRVAEAG